MKPCAFTSFISFSVIKGLLHAVSLGVPPELASSWLPRFQPGIKFCENCTEAPFVASGAGFGFCVVVVVVAGFAVVVSGFCVVVVVVVVVVVSGFGVVVVVVVVVVVTVVVSAFVAVVVVAAVVSAFVVLVVVAAVVEAELFSDDVAAFPEQAEMPVITIMPLIRAASILFFIGTFLSLTARFLRWEQPFFIVSIIL